MADQDQIEVSEAAAVVPDGLEDYVDDWHMSPGLSADGFLFLTGMTATENGAVSPDPAMQIEKAFDKVARTLRAAGVDFSSVVEMTSYHVGLRDHIELFRAIRDRYVTPPYPAWTAIEVGGFITDGAIVELRVIARARAGGAT